MRAKIIAVDFDGTLIEDGKWPGIGSTNEEVLNYCKNEQKKGARIILWTNRAGESLETAIKWCEEHDLHLDAVNDNLPESVEFFGTNTRKVYADEFIDDRMLKGLILPYRGESNQINGGSNMDVNICQETRLCKVGDEYGYFHTWEHYSKPLPASPLVGGEPAGVFSQVFGIVEFHDGVRRVDPTQIKFHDDVCIPKETVKGEN